MRYVGLCMSVAILSATIVHADVEVDFLKDPAEDGIKLILALRNTDTIGDTSDTAESPPPLPEPRTGTIHAMWEYTYSSSPGISRSDSLPDSTFTLRAGESQEFSLGTIDYASDPEIWIVITLSVSVSEAGSPRRTIRRTLVHQAPVVSPQPSDTGE